jgi:hypothetical protein
VILQEKDLFELVKKHILPDLQESEYKVSKYDCYSLEKRIDIELKCRRTHYDDLVIEKMKFDALILRSDKYNTTPVYINSTPNGVWSFQISMLPEPMWKGRKMPTTTDFSNNSMIIKQVGYYNVSLGKDLTTILKLK